MNAQTKMSEKGQVVVPKATRDRLGWQPGTDLEVVETTDSVTFRRWRRAKSLTMEQAIERLGTIYRHQGPPVSLEEMDDAIGEAVAERWTRNA